MIMADGGEIRNIELLTLVCDKYMCALLRVL